MQDEKNVMFQMRFPQKLWYLVNLRTDAILWGGTKRTILLNYRILHSYLRSDHSIFKTTNISSFVRQLNLYGFRKVTSHLQDPLCNSSNPYMHEYVHEYFQFGRPDLLNKINRKALTMKKNYKPKNLFSEEDMCSYMTPLQKARQALQLALKKAAHDLYFQYSQTSLQYYHENEDVPEEYCENEENVNMNWFSMPTENVEETPQQAPTTPEATVEDNVEEKRNFGNSGDDIFNFSEESSQQTTESNNYPNQFLSMPELDPEPLEESQGVELLVQFNIDDEDDEGIVRKISDKTAHSSSDTQNSLNCVLPSISSDQNDDVSVPERSTGFSGHYHGEWDQMFNDHNQEGSDLKDLYSQISKTIDLLNS